MADFDDITGWREELAAFEKTEEGRAFFAGNKRYGGIKVPYENVVQMVVRAAKWHLMPNDKTGRDRQQAPADEDG